MDHLVIERRPDLHDPVAVIAFSGWNDAASAATNAARFVVRRIGARKFASIDAEPFYDFTGNRPSVRLDSKGTRKVHWPTNEFFYARNPGGAHDIVVALGTEPNLRWRTFSEIHTGLLTDLHVSLAVSLGALMAEVPHTREVRVTGTAIDPEVARDLRLTTSRYEGPTGIVGVLHDSMRQRGVPAASLWANVPHYITTAQNPPATIALLRRLQSLLGVEFDYTELLAAGQRFVAEVDNAVSGNPEMAAYLRRLEAAIDAGQEASEGRGASSLPPPEDVVLDIEEFLRGQRDSG